MYSYGNGKPEVCALNVLRTIIGECPYTRGMGLRAHIDRPYTEEVPGLDADVKRQLDIYEPRVETDNVDVLHELLNGDYTIYPYIRRVSDEP